MVERTHTGLVNVRESAEVTSKITQSIQSTLERIATVITSEVIPQLKTLVEQMTRVWQSNARVVSLVTKMQESPTPAVQYTWFQTPVKFEDALGRVFPIPSEFDWLKVEAIIIAHFSTGPGHAKVAVGEYELFDPLDSSEIISESNFNGLRPGMSLTMALIIGQYSHAFGGNERCPRPGCRSSTFTLSDGGRQCTKCNICFADARTRLPLPYRDDTLNQSFENYDISTRTLSPRKMESIGIWDGRSVGIHFHKATRKERLRFKNIRLSHLPLPRTPPVGNVRRTTKWNAIDSRRNNHGVERKMDLMYGFPKLPNTKANSSTYGASSSRSYGSSSSRSYGSSSSSIYANSAQSSRKHRYGNKPPVVHNSWCGLDPNISTSAPNSGYYN
ncbi:hypothetical protein GQ44DRAFT_764431 [Phaeosphaeriaceae sp. PMI808]|nr:hypothetical protein GQ44DRAFT_764431 [Phaeosphaeriaceae sp. PMI808]